MPDDRITAQPSTGGSPAGEADDAEPDSECRRVIDYLKHQGGIVPVTADEKRILAGLEAEGLARKEGDTYFYAGDRGGEEPEGRAIDGWLILPAMELILGLFTAAWLAYKDIKVLGNRALDHRPAAGTAVAVDLIANAGMLPFQLFVAVAFFRRKRSAPARVIALLLVGVVIALADGWAIGAVKDQEGTVVGWLIVSLVKVAI